MVARSQKRSIEVYNRISTAKGSGSRRLERIKRKGNCEAMKQKDDLYKQPCEAQGRPLTAITITFLSLRPLLAYVIDIVEPKLADEGIMNSLAKLKADP
jgi:hypothetical protein